MSLPWYSLRGYTGNFFHDFNDGIIPLFITIHSVFSENQEFVLVISKARDWWVRKYADLLQTFSKHPIINLDNDSSAHCFTSATIGLVSHGFMTINPKLLPNSQTLIHFRSFLDRAYGRHRGENHATTVNSLKRRPRLVLMSRSGGVGRVILNQIQVKRIAEKIGFDVTIFEPTANTPLWQAYAVINSSHAMVGVHGRAMGLEYMEYRIEVEESSLVDKYDKNSLMLKDPIAFQGKKWSNDIMSIYLKEQNVRLDLARFREYLKNAYKKAKKFVDKGDSD
ncbi:hypothetical protein GH714_028693 [Hevea brasiliensis]|uniref:Glycosyltransferase family 61 protein n=1 Tax=Hevea brasiliensis TaxID=3981 RepID=A0A6A6NJU3_HEVBR|nr:hypothetical protein GH714_028693 [Hevea brasiliensis]